MHRFFLTRFMPVPRKWKDTGRSMAVMADRRVQVVSYGLRCRPSPSSLTHVHTPETGFLLIARWQTRPLIFGFSWVVVLKIGGSPWGHAVA